MPRLHEPPPAPTAPAPSNAGAAAGPAEPDPVDLPALLASTAGVRRKGLRRVIHPPLWVLVLLHVAGWLLIVLGVLGLFLPILQGVLFLFAGLAVLSIASETMHRFFRQRFRRFPKAWRQLERLRRTITRHLPTGRSDTAA